MGSAMDEEAFIASVAQFLKKENEDRARHFEEQRLHSQNLERQMMEMKELLLNMAKGQQEAASAPRSPTSPLNEQSESVDDYLGRFECAHQVLDKMSEPKESHNLELSDEEKLKCDELVHRDVESSQILVENEPKSAKESSVLIAHQLLDKMPQPTKTIEVDLIDELTKDVNVDDLLEMASWIEEDCEPPTYAKGYMRLTCFDPGGEEHKNLKVFECAVDAFSQGAKDEFSLVFDFLTWEIFVGFVPRISQGAKNYCDETLIFDPGGLIVINNFSFLAASGEPSFGHTIDVGELELSLEDFSYVGSDSHGAGVVVFDPGGECSMLTDEMLELKQKTCRGHCLSLCDRNFWAVKNVSGRILVGLRWWNEIDDLCEMYGSLNHFDQEFPVYFCLILGDKDHLKEGVLLQENGC